VAEQARLVLLIGMGGMGKTTFAAHRTRQLADHFSHVIWRTLVNVPTAETILHTWVQSLAGQHPLAWPEQFDEQIHLLLHYLREKRCLLILDNFESVLQEQTQAGHYRTGYEPYGQLLRAIGNSDHQSTLLITSREEPYALTRLMDAAGRVQRLELRGLDLNAGRALLAERGLADSVAIEIALVMRASGSPLALKIIAETIRDLFAGNIGAFLSDETFIFDSVRDVLAQQFARLSALEQAILLWLAIEREEVSLADLQANLAPPVARHTFLEAVRSLERRSLLEKNPLGFTLQQVVAEHALAYLIAETCREIVTGTPRLLKSHALGKALTKEYLRESQQRLILHPILEGLEHKLGRDGVEAQLRTLLTGLRTAATDVGLDGTITPAQGNYAAGNILDLLVALESDLRGWDFSYLPIWQAHLAQVHLPAVDFRHADFAKTSFADAFGLVHGVAFHPSGQELAATAEHEIRLWRDPDGQRSGVLRGHTDDVWSIAFNDEG
ncbi:MAG: AAA family ATPase, partial [Caldilineaceae bacterium]|nr:AAA family ATPase [Caldilineaceae bacterium]